MVVANAAESAQSELAAGNHLPEDVATFRGAESPTILNRQLWNAVSRTQNQGSPETRAPRKMIRSSAKPRPGSPGGSVVFWIQYISWHGCGQIFLATTVEAALRRFWAPKALRRRFHTKPSLPLWLGQVLAKNPVRPVGKRSRDND